MFPQSNTSFPIIDYQAWQRRERLADREGEDHWAWQGDALFGRLA